MRIALGHVPQCTGGPALDRSAGRGVPLRHGEGSVAPGCSRPWPPRRSGWPTASRSRTASARATRDERRRTIAPDALGLPYETTSVPLGRARPPRVVHPGARRSTGSGDRPGPRLGVGARPDAPDGASSCTPPGFHCLTFDVRGHGANPAEADPISAGEFGADALAAFRTLLARPEVTIGGVSGHSMGGIGAILAAAADPAGRRPDRLVVAGRPVPAHPTDLPARPPPDPRPDRLPARLADHAGLRATARPRRARHQRHRTRSPDTAGRSCSPTAPSDSRRPAGAHGPARGGRPSDTWSRVTHPVETAPGRGRPALLALRTRRTTGERWPAWPRRRPGWADGPRCGRRHRGGHRAERIPDGEAASRRPRTSTAARGPSPGSSSRARPDASPATTSRDARPADRRRRAGSRRAVTDRGPGLGGDPDPAGDPTVRRPARSTPAHLERILARRASGRQLQEPPALGVHRVPRPRDHLAELAAVGP